MEKKSVIVLFLVLSLFLFSSFAAANVNVLGVSVVSPANVTNSSAAKVVMALKAWDNASGTIDSVVVQAVNLSGAFTADGDLAPLSADSTSGVQIYKDANSNGVYDAGTDSRLTYTVSDWSAVTNNRQNVTFSSISGLTLPSTVPSNANVFIIIRTAGAASDEAQFNITIEQSAVKSSANSTGSTNSTPIGSGRIYVDATNPGAATLVSPYRDIRVNDTDRDGYIDQVRVVLTEAINDTGIDATGFSLGNISNFTINSGYLASGLTFWTGPETNAANDNIFYINFTEVTAVRFTNQSTVALNYSTNGTIKDIAGNSLQAFTNLQPLDGAAPVLLNISTNDANVTDGRVDGLLFTFTEPINDSAVNFSNTGLKASQFTIANGTLHTSTINTANDELYIVAVNQVNTTRDGNLTGHFNASASRVGMFKDRALVNDLVADEQDSWVGNLTFFAIDDRVAPMVEKFETIDSDNNGWLDAIRINFSEPILDSSISVGDLLSIEITGEFNNTGARQNLTNLIGCTNCFVSNYTDGFLTDTANNSIVYLNFSEVTAKFNTSGLMRINITPGATVMDMTNLNRAATNISNTLTTDKAAPVIMGGLTYNLTSADSTIDYINLTLSEWTSQGNAASSGFTIYVNTEGVNTTSRATALVLGTNNVTVAANSSNITLGFNGLVVGTGNVTLNYTGTYLNDSAGNFMRNQTGIHIQDNMRPVLYSADYLDNTSNGYVETVRLNFTEQMNKSSFNSYINLVVPVTQNFSISGISTDTGQNFNFSNSPNGTTPLGSEVSPFYAYFYWSNANTTHRTNASITLNVSGYGSGGQTNTTPGGDGNLVSDNMGLGIDAIANQTVNDKAPPAILSAITYDTDGDGKINNINVTLSENPGGVSTVGAMNSSVWSIVVTGGSITNKNILSVSSSIGVQTGNVSIILSDGVDGTGNVTLNYTHPSTGGNINDSAGNNMDNVVAYTSTIDNASPVIMTRFTVDNDSNGWVEQVALNFSEEINDSSIAQQLDLQNGRNFNLTVEIISKEALPNLNWSTGSTANDALIYLNWSTTNTTLNATYNTTATPVINYTRGVVSDTSGVLAITNVSASHASVKATDRAAPIIMTRFTVDLDANGYLDAVGINFSEDMVDETFNGTSATNNASAWNVSGISGNGLRVDFNTLYNSDSVNNNVIYLNWTVANTLYKTNGTPTVNYTATTSNVSDKANNLLATSSYGLGAVDRVAPRIMNITTIDNDSNGWLDAVRIYWSEPINDNTFKGYDFNVSGVGFSTATAIVGGPDSHALNFTASYHGDLANDDITYINWSFNNSRPYHGIHNTGATPVVNYTAGNLSDMNNVLAATNTTGGGTTALDKAVPRIMDVFTVDNNSNGYLDAVGINFSENINDSTLSAQNVTQFNISGINSIASALRVDFTTNYHGDSLNNNIIYLNWTFASTTFNTSGRPLLNYTSGNLSDNANTTTNLAPSNTSSVISQDRAAPAILSFVAADNTTGVNGYDSDDTLTLAFSEAINNASLNNNSVFLVNGSNTDGIEQVLALNGTKKWNNISTALWINANQTLVVTLHASNFTNMTVGDVVTPNATMRDAAGNTMGLSSATLTGTFDDTTAPQVTNVETHDNDTDGKIDAIIISLSETVLNRTYNSGAANATNFSSGFTVGYDAGQTFTVVGPGQNNSGSVILINVTEKSTFNTSIRPWVSYSTSIGNLTDMGTNANRLASFNLTANDSVMPVPVNVSTYDNDSDGFIDMVNVTFSEEINDSSINISNIYIGGTTQASNGTLRSYLFNTRNGASASANDSYAEISFLDGLNNTGDVPQFVSNGTGTTPSINFIVQDLSTTGGGNYLQSLLNATVVESDGAKPVFRALNTSTNNFSNSSKMGSGNSTTLWFQVSEPVKALVVVIGNVTAQLLNNQSYDKNVSHNFTYNFTALSVRAAEGNQTIRLSALDLADLNGTNLTQSITFDFTAPNAITSVNVSDRSNDDGKHLKVLWAESTNTTNGGDFARYRVYLDVNTFTTSIAGKQPHNSSFTTNATVRTVIGSINTSNLTDGTTYYVAVTAVDDVGNENTTITTNGSAAPYDNAQVATTVNNWNLVSTPQTLQNTTKAASFNSSYTMWYYNASSSAWEQPNVIDQYKGYWLYDNAVNLSINLSFKNNEGPNPTLAQQNLSVGWNMIGASHEASTYVNTTLLSISGKYSVVYEFTPGSGWRTHTPGVTTVESGTEFLNMTVGKGYWIYMTSSATYSGGDI